MIIYGSKPVHLKTAQPSTFTCPQCQRQGSTQLSIFSKHAHLYWIPMFPMGRIGESQCQNCQQVLGVQEMPEELQKEYNRLKEETKAPLWQFAGAGLVAIAIVLIFQSGQRTKKLEQEYLSQPMMGDTYEYKEDYQVYSTFKIVEVYWDSVAIQPNDYSVNKSSGFSQIDKPENYSEFIYMMSREDLKAMYEDGDILGINRD